MKIKINLKEIREEKGLTQKELALKADISIYVITSIEQHICKNPYILSMFKLSKALNIKLEDLVEIEEETK